MKSEKNIFIAFVLNLAFAAVELAGGAVIGSVAVVSDAVHDLGDAVGIGVSWLLERKSREEPDGRYPFGYARYSVMGGAVTTFILILGSAAVVHKAVVRMFAPVEIRYDGMILLAIVGVCVNGCAAWVTRDGDSLNRRAVNLHMLEDVLGWAAVLAGAVVMRFTGFTLLDPILSVATAAFVLVNALKNLREITEIVLEKTPRGIAPEEVRQRICGVAGVVDVRRLCLWSLDGQHHCAAACIVTEAEHCGVKAEVRKILREYGVVHATLEVAAEGEPAENPVPVAPVGHGHHHRCRHHHST